MTKLVVIEPKTKSSADQTLSTCFGHYDKVCIIGWTDDGTFQLRANTDPKDCLWLSEELKLILLEHGFEVIND